MLVTTGTQEMTKLLRLEFTATSDPREFPRYTIADVAHFLRIKHTTLRDWVRGRPYPKGSGQAFSRPVIEPADPDGPVLSFFNLVEAHIIKSTRQRDEVPLLAIRDAIDYVSEHFPGPHPLLTNDFYTEGRHLFIKKLDELINASKRGQLGIEPILGQYLDRINRDVDGMPLALNPFIPSRPNSRAVSIQFKVSSGAPVITGTGILVSAIRGRHAQGESISDLAEDYALAVDTIEDAIAYLEAA